jgi:hypothetical protein
MKANIVILPTGEVSIVTQEGAFEAGKERIEALLQALKLQGLKIDLAGQIEQHRHDDEGGHLANHEHAH